jgi:sporulation protein YlmC with PRC-barrel domain
MKYLIDVLDKPVVDGAGKKLGVLKGLDLDLSSALVYLRVSGDLLLDIRGRNTEFIALSEIDYADDKEIHLYKSLKELKKDVLKTGMNQEQNYRAQDLVGKEVRTTSGEVIGVMSDLAVAEDFNDGYLVVKGPKIREIQGNDSEQFHLDNFLTVDKGIVINHDYDTLAKRVRESDGTV